MRGGDEHDRVELELRELERGLVALVELERRVLERRELELRLLRGRVLALLLLEFLELELLELELVQLELSPAATLRQWASSER